MSLTVLVSLLVFQQAPASPSEEELGFHITRMTREVDDTTRPFPQRVTTLLEIASAIDRVAQAQTDQAKADAYWTDAIRRLDELTSKYESVERASLLPVRLQAAIYAWEQARSFALRSQDELGVPALDQKAIERFDNARTRLEGVLKDAGEDPLIEPNARYRLAQVLGDRAGLTQDPAERLGLNQRAIESLREPFRDPRLMAFAGLLKVDLLRKAGKLDEAAKELAAVEALDTKPAESDLLPVLVDLAIAQSRFKDAATRIKASGLSASERAVLMVRLLLAERSSIDAPEGRSRLEADLLKEALALRGTTDREGRQALRSLATAIETPGPGVGPGEVEFVAEGHQLAGRFDRAAELLLVAADRASLPAQRDQAVQDRLRAGAIWFQRNNWARAAFAFARAEEGANTENAARASLLRILSIQRGLAEEGSGFSRDELDEAMNRHTSRFPTSPTTDEVRWLLGSTLRQQGKSEAGAQAWARISPSSRRWLDARLALANDQESQLLAVIPLQDSGLIESKARVLRRSLQKGRDEAQDRADQDELNLQLSRLDLLPGAGNPEEARERLASLLNHSATAAQHARARVLLVVALAEAGHVLEAETKARSEAGRCDVAGMLEAVHLLDLAATDTDSELTRIRLAAVAKIFLAPWSGKGEKIAPLDQREVLFRTARIHALSGELVRARAMLTQLNFQPEQESGQELRELSDLYMRVEAYGLVVDVERLRSRRLTAGTVDWFLSRYTIALAFYRSKKLDDAREIIDATAILHPELGGPVLKQKFEKLRRRIAEDR